MAEKRYYWLKLQRDFFKRHDIKIVETMPNGKDYVLFYLKLLLESLDHDGQLRFSDTIPYSEPMLATITDTNIDVVRSAMKLFIELRMIEVLSDSTIFMNEVCKMLGSESWGAKRVRDFREKGQRTLQCNTDVTNSNAHETPCNLELESEKELELELESESTCFEKFWNAYPRKVGKGAAEQSFKKYRPDDELLKTILAAIENQKRSEQWQKDNGKYIPNPATWINQKRWEDECQIYVLQKRAVTFDIAEYEASGVFDNMDIPRR